METLQEVAVYFILALVCGIGAWLLKTKKEQLLKTIADLCQKAEEAVQGSGLGAEKKAKVIAYLEAAGVSVTDTVSNLIDEVVEKLNKKSGWLVSSATSTATAAVKTE
ncbi:hypothetical protein [Syntrophobotulus glycolicus]|uniref:hypothetical protein n=1 Tax=Syntrophobotulus glycolicus TaxID=51197 RepID=UPI0011D0810D|nr:hypothetical protein [Syntrophobotulus glycolicus]